MSYIDQGLKPYSYPFPSNITGGLSPASTPNLAGSGNIPDGTAVFAVANGNHSGTLTLPPVSANSIPIFLRRFSTAATRVAITNTLLTEPLLISNNECVHMIPTEAGWVWVDHSVDTPKVSTQMTLPNVSGLPLTPTVGDRVLVTGDGTYDSHVNSEWFFNGVRWEQATNNSTETAVMIPGGIQYYVNPIFIIDKLPATVPTTTVTGLGFTLAGTATNTAFAGPWNGRGLIQFGATVLTAAAAPSDANHFIAPVNYVGHEIPINVNTTLDHAYFIKCLADRRSIYDVWVCNATTGVPEKKLHSLVSSAAYSGRHCTPQLSPRDEFGNDSIVFEWLATTIPAAIVAAYKTANNTLKLAIRPGVGNQEGDLFYYAGYAVTLVNRKYTHLGGNAAGLGTYAGNLVGVGGAVDGLIQMTVNANSQTTDVRIPLPGIDKDVFLSVVGSGANGSRYSWLRMTIQHSSGNVDVGRLRPAIKAPVAIATHEFVGNGHDIAGWRIPAATLAAKATQPTNSVGYYLTVTLQNMNASTYTEFFNFVIEQVN